jgi:hypothetical protein
MSTVLELDREQEQQYIAAYEQSPSDGLEFVQMESVEPIAVSGASQYEQRYRALRADLGRLTLLEDGWDGYGSPAPQLGPLAFAMNLLPQIASLFERFAVTVAPAAEGGVAFAFRVDAKYAEIELDNDGTALALTSTGVHDSVAEEFAYEQVPSKLPVILEFLQPSR